MSDTLVEIQEPAPGVSLITINRPDRRNALNFEIKGLLADAVEKLDTNPQVRVIIIVGAGSCFAAGSDVAEMQTLTPIEHTLRATDRMFSAVRRCSKPVVAAVEGYALGGGCELALSCDMIIAGESAKFGQPEIRLGVMPGAGATQHMVRTIGKYQTLRLLLTGERIDARSAYALGLVSELSPDGNALKRSLEVATTIAEMPPLAVKAIKEVVHFGADAPSETAMLLERRAFQVLFDSADQKEGMQAFLDKRTPHFQGR
jgi:enoyl-CoA hydratase/carnithine racemase